VVSSALQRERTALKIMMQLLVDNQDTMELGELVPVGSLFGAMLDGHDAFSAELRYQFDKARKLWEQKLRPALLRSAGLTEDTVRTLPADHAQVRRFRTDERIVGTLVLSALAPEAETLRALTARRLTKLSKPFDTQPKFQHRTLSSIPLRASTRQSGKSVGSVRTGGVSSSQPRK
jgi:hypothetical protein